MVSAQGYGRGACRAWVHGEASVCTGQRDTGQGVFVSHRDTRQGVCVMSGRADLGEVKALEQGPLRQACSIGR